MRKRNIILSIIVVHYKAKDALFRCLLSLKKFPPTYPYEVIVVDNDEVQEIEEELTTQFSWVHYIKTTSNRGYGAGNNTGAKKAKGAFLFFLNPDTIVFHGAIDLLVNFLLKNTDTAIVSPLLLDKKNKPLRIQGSKELTPLEGIVCLSFINKFFPNNPISKKYFLSDWDKKVTKEVDVIPGTAFVIRRNVFEEIGGFDERFFLYFEEHDLCRRVKRAGYTIYMIPMAKLVHYGAMSARYRSDTTSILAKSRFLYFRKHFGLASALLVEIFATLGRRRILRFLHRLYA